MSDSPVTDDAYNNRDEMDSDATIEKLRELASNYEAKFKALQKMHSCVYTPEGFNADDYKKLDELVKHDEAQLALWKAHLKTAHTQVEYWTHQLDASLTVRGRLSFHGIQKSISSQ